jgi:hypothetical protein
MPVDHRSPELEAKLHALYPADELAYRYVCRETPPHCLRDPDWQARIADLKLRGSTSTRSRGPSPWRWNCARR